MTSKKSKLKQYKTIDGKLETFKPTTIEQALGAKGVREYSFLRNPFSPDEYEAYLKDLVESDLYEHATKHNCIPTDNRDRLIKKLLVEHRNHAAKFAPQTISASNDPTNVPDKIKKFMAGAK